MFENLFTSGNIGTMRTKNRIVFTPMGNALANTDGTVSERDIQFYGARARGGVGVVFSECTIVDGETGRGNSQQICVYDDKFIPGLKALADEIHKYDSKVIVQIYHPGRQGISEENGNQPMFAPSEIECLAVHQPTRAMSKEQIKDMVNKFVEAAVRIQKSGIDGVEVHGAHGYLINEFLSPYTNKRTDEYGGNTENRMRFLEEIIIGIRNNCGKDYPIVVRLSVDEYLEYSGVENEGLKLEESVKIAKRLEELGVDAINVSSGIYETMNIAWEPSSFEQGWKTHLSKAIKDAVKIPVIGVSVIRDPEYADQIIKEGKLDFAGSARQHFADPEWSNKAKDGRVNEIRKCISCLLCMETLTTARDGKSNECSINIQSGKESEYDHFNENGDGKVVAIIGAGPAGLEAARILALRNFKPIIFEKSNQLGGQLQLANKPPHKEKINWLIDYLTSQTENNGIEIRYNNVPTIEDLKALNPYAIFIAQGSNPIMPKSIPGIDGKNVVSTVEILNGDVQLTNENVIVVGSGMTGIETAHLLANSKNQVKVFEMADNIGPGLWFQNIIDIMNHMMPLGVQLYPKHKLVEINENSAGFENIESGEKESYDFDHIIISLGTESNKELITEIQEVFQNVKLIGDTKKVGRIRSAMETGFLEAYNLKG